MRWIDLDGAVNVRDLGGLPTRDGGHTATGRVLRADNLQGLSAADVSIWSTGSASAPWLTCAVLARYGPRGRGR